MNSELFKISVLILAPTALADAKLDSYKTILTRQISAQKEHFLTEKLKADAQYLEHLERLKAQAQNEGNLEQTIAYSAEIERFAQTGMVPAPPASLPLFVSAQRQF